MGEQRTLRLLSFLGSHNRDSEWYTPQGTQYYLTNHAKNDYLLEYGENSDRFSPDIIKCIYLSHRTLWKSVALWKTDVKT